MELIYKAYSFLSQKAKLNAIIFILLALIITIASNEIEAFDASMHVIAISSLAVSVIYLLLVELSFIEALGIIKSFEVNRTKFSLNFIGFYSAMISLMSLGFIFSSITEGQQTLNVLGFVSTAIFLALGIIFFIVMNYFQLKEALSLSRNQTLAFMFIAFLLYLAGLQLVSSIVNVIQSMIFPNTTLYDWKRKI